MNEKKTFSFDAETNGLWGKAFSIAAVIIDENGDVESHFMARIHIDPLKMPDFVRSEILPNLGNIPITHETYEEMLRAFAEYYMENKADCDIVCHMGYIVESKIIRDMYELGFIGEWDAPFPLLDVSGNLDQGDQNPMSIDDFMRHNWNDLIQDRLLNDMGLEKGMTHNPLYDALMTAIAYRWIRAKANSRRFKLFGKKWYAEQKERIEKERKRTGYRRTHCAKCGSELNMSYNPVAYWYRISCPKCGVIEERPKRGNNY